MNTVNRIKLHGPHSVNWTVRPSAKHGMTKVVHAGSHCVAILLDKSAQDGPLISAAPDMFAAIGVCLLDPAISEWLKENDPKAFEQLVAARAKADRPVE